jgi:hypothetical protein
VVLLAIDFRLNQLGDFGVAVKKLFHEIHPFLILFVDGFA